MMSASATFVDNLKKLRSGKKYLTRKSSIISVLKHLWTDKKIFSKLVVSTWPLAILLSITLWFGYRDATAVITETDITFTGFESSIFTNLIYALFTIIVLALLYVHVFTLNFLRSRTDKDDDGTHLRSKSLSQFPNHLFYFVLWISGIAIISFLTFIFCMKLLGSSALLPIVISSNIFLFIMIRLLLYPIYVNDRYNLKPFTKSIKHSDGATIKMVNRIILWMILMMIIYVAIALLSLPVSYLLDTDFKPIIGQNELEFMFRDQYPYIIIALACVLILTSIVIGVITLTILSVLIEGDITSKKPRRRLFRRRKSSSKKSKKSEDTVEGEKKIKKLKTKGKKF